MKIVRFNKVLVAALVLFQAYIVHSQSCTFTGLNPGYCPTSPNAPLTTTATGGFFKGTGVIGSAFSPSIAGPGTWTVAYGTCTSTYAISQYSTVGGPNGYNPLPISGESTVTLSDDMVSGALNIGFNFRFFCVPYTQFYISSNGFITFSAGQPNGCCTGQTLPDNTTPNNLIAFPWDDWNPATGGTITYGTVGTAPNRKLLVNFTNIYHFGGSGPELTTQIQLHEGTDLIEIHTGTFVTDGTGHTMGVEDGAGLSAFVVPNRNSSGSWSVSNELVRFTPGFNACQTQTTTVFPTTIAITGNTAICSGQSATLTPGPGTTYTWTGGLSSNNSSIVVNPTSNTVYSLSSTNAIGCVASNTVAVNVSPGAPVISVNAVPGASICLGNKAALTASGALSYTWSNAMANGGTVQPQANTQYTVSGQNGCGITTTVVNVTVTPLPVVIVQTPTVVCAGSPSTLMAIAAANAFTWTTPQSTVPSASVIVSPQVPSVYTVAATDGTCRGSGAILLSPNPVPTLMIGATSTNVCVGAAVTLTVSGADSYVWSPGGSTLTTIVESPTAPTLYSVVGTNSFGCTSMISLPVIVQASPKLTVSATKTLVCPNETVTVSAAGANTFTWSTGSNTNSDVVTVTGNTVVNVTAVNTTVNACPATGSVAISVFAPTITLSGSTVVCKGQTVTITAGGGDSYSWGFTSMIVTPTANSTYTVEGTSTFTDQITTCSSTAAISIMVNALPTVSASATRTNLCTKSETSTLTAGGAVSYVWTGFTGTVATGPAFTYSSATQATPVYSVTGTDANGCSNTATLSLRVTNCTGISEAIAPAISIYPNPNTGDFSIETEAELDLVIVSELGQVVRELRTDRSNAYKVKVSELANGVYFIRAKGGQLNQKIIVNK